jgi:uncharacterized protein YbjT (DUF2867 family)
MIGSELCRQLSSEGSGFDRVVALTRRPLDFSFPKIIEQRVEVGQLDQLDDAGPFDAAFCTLGTTIKTAGSQEAFRLVDYDYVVAFARFAKRAGVATFVLLTSVGAKRDSGNFYLRVKGEVEAAVEALAFPSLYIFRPSFLMGQRREFRQGEKAGIAAAKALQFALIGPFRKYRPITSETVAAGMRQAALEAAPGRHVCHYDDIVALSKQA